MDKKNKPSQKEHPVIYTYIYERELEDINRLKKSVESKPLNFDKKGQDMDSNKVIIRFDFFNGELNPVYKTKVDKVSTSEVKPVAVQAGNNVAKAKVTKAKNEIVVKTNKTTVSPKVAQGIKKGATTKQPPKKTR
ncbi:hypothetical protein [Chitinophaga agri]|uniref:Uncharacterized protein n=1 Tax=Chitinophaga agri TaxID=2703787 RepID=A0A6B9ZFM2_9BACT|nr:hypothetical protein [Chitinophaga agri]QHS61252.1 hypothetical protein GWR21_17100 [Chitinophaga agri]